jgi:hypothetical protein
MYGGLNKREGNGKLAIRRMKPSRSWDSIDELGVARARVERRDGGDGEVMNGLGLIKIE